MTPLPIDNRLSEISRLISSSQTLVLTAEPGAGKTTRVPPHLLDYVEGKIIVLQPRRMAAVAACHRICEERGWSVGREAGYLVRFEAKWTEQTRLIFMTDAMLLRKILENPELNGIGMVIIDEFHERNLNQDLILGYVKEQQELGTSIRLLVMSATLNVAKMKRFLPDSSSIEVEGQSFPLTVENQAEGLSLRTDGEFYDRVSGTVREALRRGSGDVLVFLPGVGEIERTRERLQLTNVDVEVLHGSMQLREQQRVLRVGERRRVILATNVAEASVTVQGVDCVIDTGVAKVMQCHLRTGFSQLELQRISLFNAKQRAGRAARQKEGLCIRMWTTHEENTQAVEPVAECQRVDLTQTLLWLAKLGVNRFEQFAWLDHPPGRLLDFARRSLLWLGAIDGDNRITTFGEKLVSFPLPPRWGALMAMGEEMGLGTTAARMAAILSERDFVGGPIHSPVQCDLWSRMESLAEGRGRSAESVRMTARQLEGLVGQDRSSPDLKDVQRLFLLSQGDRLCRRRSPKGETALMTGQRGVRLARDSQVKSAEFFVALQGVDLPGQADTLITLASGFDKDFVLQVLGNKVAVSEDVYFDREKEQFFARRGRFVFDLPIDQPTLTPIDAESVSEAMALELWKIWDELQKKNEGLGRLMGRWRFLLQYKPEMAEALTDEKIQEALAMAGYGSVGIRQVLEKDLVGFIRTALGRDVAAILDREVPSVFKAPSGLEHKIDYSESHSAYVDVRLQEMFGMRASPRVAFDQVPLTFRLLGPNYRPVQVTSDLANFWRVGYLEVRKELRSRYPKHSWPEDPLTAKPEAKGRRSKS